jgi:3-oxoisoapionate decarboxylase
VTSLLGLSTYAYFWRMSDRVPEPMSLDDALRDAAAHGITLFQICDHLPLDTASDDRLAEVKALADELGITLEVGTRGTAPEHLARYLHIAGQLGAVLVRSMWSNGADNPDPATQETRIRTAIPAYEQAGVTLALETYEVVPTAWLVDLATTIDSEYFGICLDPANTVANLELPADVVARCAPFTKNWHVKDFDFTRSPGWVGFQYTGVAFGTGRLDYAAIDAAIRPDERDINRVIEFWLPWQSDEQTTIRTEAAWVTTTIEHIRSITS